MGPQTYSAVAQCPEFSRCSGTLRIGRQHLHFTCEKGELEFPLTSLNIVSAGNAGRFIIFNHPDFPDCSIQVADQKILKDPLLERNVSAAFSRQVDRHKGIRRWVLGMSIAVAVFIVLSLTSVVLFRRDIIRYGALKLPRSVDVQMAQQATSQLNKHFTLVENEQLNQQIALLAEPLLQLVQIEDIQFRFVVVEDDTYNAAAFPDGTILLHTGFLQKAISDEEIQAVLAHELAHVAQRHTLLILAEKGSTYIAFSLLLGDVSQLMVLAGTQLLSLEFSRDQEREADKLGWEYCLQANIHPAGFVESFTRMAEMPEAEVHDAVDFLTTHPSSKERVNRFEEKLSEYQSAEKVSPRSDNKILQKIQLILKEHQAVVEDKKKQ